MSAAVPVNPIPNNSAAPSVPAAPSGQLGNHKATNITGGVKDLAKNVAEKGKGALNAVKKEWGAMSHEEKGYYMLAALCFLIAIIVIITLGVILGPAAIIPAVMIVQPIALLGALSLAGGLHLKKQRTQDEMPSAPKGIDAKDWENRWKEMRAAKEKLEEARYNLDQEKQRLIDQKREAQANFKPDTAHQMTLQVAFTQAQDAFNKAEESFKVLQEMPKIPEGVDAQIWEKSWKAKQKAKQDVKEALSDYKAEKSRLRNQERRDSSVVPDLTAKKALKQAHEEAVAAYKQARQDFEDLKS